MKIKIPKKVKLAGVPVEIITVDDVTKLPSEGYFEMDNGKILKVEEGLTEGMIAFHVVEHSGPVIYLDKRSKGEFLTNVFLHELVHAMFSQLAQEELNNNEILVQGLANLLQEVIPQIVDNGK